MSDTLLEIDRELLRAYFDSKPFLVGHRLAGHPLFTLPRLVELARRLPPEYVEYNAGRLPVGARPGETPHNGLSPEETIRRIEECGSWMVLKRVEQDPEYRVLLDRCLDEIGLHLDAPMLRREGFIFVSSPEAVTPFHLDPEHNFLLQIRGKKTVNMWDPSDRYVISERALEKFHSDFEHRNLPWKDAFQTSAYKVELGPGQGLHFPVTVPHWVKNGAEPSISFSVTFRTPASQRREHAYRANARLRRLGIEPTPVGRSPILDSTKHVAVEAYTRLRSLFARGEGSPR